MLTMNTLRLLESSCSSWSQCLTSRRLPCVGRSNKGTSPMRNGAIAHVGETSEFLRSVNQRPSALDTTCLTPPAPGGPQGSNSTSRGQAAKKCWTPTANARSRGNSVGAQLLGARLENMLVRPRGALRAPKGQAGACLRPDTTHVGGGEAARATDLPRMPRCRHPQQRLHFVQVGRTTEARVEHMSSIGTAI